MVTQINTHAWRKLIQEDIDWLRKQERTLEREHVLEILEGIKRGTVSQYLEFWEQTDGDTK